MTTFTKEQLIEIIKRNITVMDRYPDLVTAQMDLEVYKIALASLEAEPIAYIFKHPAGKLFWSLTDESNKEQPDVISVYAASPAPISSEAIENAIEYIRSIAFHIDEGDYHGKHIAYFMRQALAWLEGYSCRDDSQGKSDNSPLPRYQVIELTMLVKQLVSQLKKAKPDCKLPDRAMDYLLRNGLVSAEGVLR
ncbi:hypothetical protein NJC34_003499 [Escherichia coli]|uniref:Bacteriophage protein n=1 Tax=Shigella dysenteriae TaxID=622 RepID=A0A3R0XJA5_SHIDY|nr:hypothetical protein [Escherichia coli]EEW1216201.1 hypothetical protein [Escherichia coli O157:H7]EGE2518391.1 hypothetical protein [Shigella dysenteriae]EHX15904.1 upf89.5 protein [Escherichia coli DEC11C]MED6464806.1 hypothetical protein [Escherichia coli O157]HDR9934474.1 hypothetical protein [Escherichia coli A9619-c2 (11c)]